MTYTIGLDYGSLSCRGVLVSTTDGTIVAEDEFVYPHAVIDHELPDGTPLPPQWALQDPDDFRQALPHIIPNLLKSSQNTNHNYNQVNTKNLSIFLFRANNREYHLLIRSANKKKAAC